MGRTFKAVFWSLGVFVALGLGNWFAGCGSEEMGVDASDLVPVQCQKAGDSCTGGMCFAVTGGGFECFKECTTVGDPCENGTCYYFGPSNDRRFFCYPPGGSHIGDSCGTATDCVAGSQCLDQGGTMNCYQVCTDTCDAGDCTDTGLGFKVCVAAATELPAGAHDPCAVDTRPERQ